MHADPPDNIDQDMATPRRGPAGALLCVLMLYLMVKTTATVSVARPSGFVRQRRSLTFPYGFDESYLEEEKEKEKEEKEKKASAVKSVGLSDVIQMGGGGGSARLEGANSKKSSTTSVVQVVTTAGDESKNATDKVNADSKGRGEDEKLAEKETEQTDQDTLYLNETFSSDRNYTGGVNISEALEDGEATTLRSEGDAADVEGDDLDPDDSEEEEERAARSINQRDTGSGSTRWRIYHILEMAGNNLGMDGRACILRSICDAVATPLNHHSNGLVGELVHVLLTPSTTDDDRGRYHVREYHAAERLGAQVGNKCRLLYPECQVSFLDLFTKFDL